jgi:hypothetical protein
MSIIAWLIVVQFLAVAGFIVSLVWLAVGILVGLKPRRVTANVTADQPQTAVTPAAEPASAWRIAEQTPETVVG